VLLTCKTSLFHRIIHKAVKRIFSFACALHCKENVDSTTCATTFNVKNISSLLTETYLEVSAHTLDSIGRETKAISNF